MIVVRMPVEHQAHWHGKGGDGYRCRFAGLTFGTLSVLRHDMAAYALGLDTVGP